MACPRIFSASWQYNSYDVLYSRLCLHYLSNEELKIALNDFYRILKPTGTFFIVVKSANDRMAKSSNSVIDEKTGLTVVSDYNLYQAPSRRFHTIESLSEAVEYIKNSKIKNYTVDSKGYKYTGKLIVKN